VREGLLRPFELSFDALCIVGFDGYVKFAESAFARMLGCTQKALVGKPFVDTIHTDDREFVGEVLAQLVAGTNSASFECRQLCGDSSLRILGWNTRGVPEEGVIYGVARDVTDWRGASDELSALRSLAALVAQGLPCNELCTLIATEIARLFDDPPVGIFRYDPNLTATVVAASADLSSYVGRGLRLAPDEPSVLASVRRTRRPVRFDESSGVGVAGAEAGTEFGVGATLGVPVVLEGSVWGAVTLGVKEGRSPLPVDTIDRVTGFTHLIVTSIANAESRAEFGRLVEEQASLRRVATLVARGTRPADVFAAVAEEVGRVIEVDSTSVVRYEADETITVVAISGENILTPVGSNWTLEGESIASRVFRTGRPARMNSFNGAGGVLAELARELGRRSAVGAPIIVDDRLWGAAVANSVTGVLPAVSEDRLAKFADLVAMAIANTEARTELTVSRARVVAAADETRRRIERDLHDGIQQRLVAIALQARVTAMMTPRPSDEVQSELTVLADQLTAALDELREISRGIHPAILSEAGLAAALKTLARRSAVPVALDLQLDSRLDEPIEVAAYYIASEALTNTAKHAQASVVELHVDRRDGALNLAIRDDGIGGADPGGGSGLIGLQDRVEALGGTISVASPPGHGTALRVVLPAASSATGVPVSTQRPAAA
jgi:PAS domain S-box-containing protein